MHAVIDCRGLLCPQPVIRAKEILDRGEDSVEVIVDNEASRSNVARFARSQGCTVEIRTSGDTHHLLLTRSGKSRPADQARATAEYVCDLPETGLVCLIPANTMGRGDDQLGSVLMRAFIKTISSLSPLPRKIFFYNTGVKITAVQSDLVEPLRELAAMGVEIYSCGTCLDFFNLKESLLVGEVTNMFDIMDSMARATKIISPH